MERYQKHRTKIITHCAILFAGLVMGWAITKPNSHDCVGEYSFININVVCGEPHVISKASYENFNRRLGEYIDEKKRSNEIDEGGVYFRDLKNGPVFGNNELAEFIPASLLKLPLALVFLGAAQREPKLLSYKIMYTDTTTVPKQEVKPKESAQPGILYSIEELLRFMLVYSDNASSLVLEAFINEDPQMRKLRQVTFQELGLVDPQTSMENTLTVRGYASLFRGLYNVSILSPETSERVLKWLVESEYQHGLRVGIPKDIKIAHKFGERHFDDSSVKQLHDCGIIYYPGNPYLLCVMTRGSDFNKLQSVIQHISGMIYEEVDSRRY